jgi:predicted alpha/beta hydrolase family esterase
VWEEERGDCTRVELGCWSAPIRNVWISRLDQAVLTTQAPIIIVAHSLGCFATVWWAALSTQDATAKVKAAILVAPPDVTKENPHPLLQRFAPEPETPLPFPALLVASHNDRFATFERQRAMAARWNCRLIDAGHLGHINAESGLGNWPEGQALLDSLIEETIRPARYTGIGGYGLTPSFTVAFLMKF